jgi:hypothetical protein
MGGGSEGVILMALVNSLVDAPAVLVGDLAAALLSLVLATSASLLKMIL